jgi:hypothetical protein
MAGQVLEQEQGWAVGPVQVVEHQDQGRRLRRVHQEGGHAVEETVAIFLRVAARSGLDVGEALRHLGDDLCDIGSSATERRAERIVGPLRDVVSDGLHEGEVGDPRLGLVAVPQQRLRTPQPRILARAFGQTRLPNAGLAGQHHERAVAAERGIDGALQAVELEGAPHELAADEAPCWRGRCTRGQRGRGELANRLDAPFHDLGTRGPILRVLLEQL